MQNQKALPNTSRGYIEVEPHAQDTLSQLAKTGHGPSVRNLLARTIVLKVLRKNSAENPALQNIAPSSLNAQFIAANTPGAEFFSEFTEDMLAGPDIYKAFLQAMEKTNLPADRRTKFHIAALIDPARDFAGQIRAVAMSAVDPQKDVTLVCAATNSGRGIFNYVTVNKAIAKTALPITNPLAVRAAMAPTQTSHLSSGPQGH